MLAVRHRRQYADEQPEVHGSFHRCRGACSLLMSLTLDVLISQIDPNRTISAGKVDIGAFRTYPENYTPPSAASSEYQSIPLSKIEDFGVHANQYYQVEVEIFKSSLDTELLGMLWNKYWVNTLSQSPLISVSFLFFFSFQRFPCILTCAEQSLCCFAIVRSSPEIGQGTEFGEQYARSCTSASRERLESKFALHLFTYCMSNSPRST